MVFFAAVILFLLISAASAASVPARKAQIGSSTYLVSGVDPGKPGGWGGDPEFPGGRGGDQLIVYTRKYGTVTDTNEWGTEIRAVSAFRVVSVNNRQASSSNVGTSIPSNGIVLSGHDQAQSWLLANAKVGRLIEVSSGATSSRTVNVTGTIDSRGRWSAQSRQSKVSKRIVIGSASYLLSGVDPGKPGGWGGDPEFPGGRGGNQLIVYTRKYGTVTDTNEWGTEVRAVAVFQVATVNNRQARLSNVGTSIPSNGIVLSGHDTAQTWLLANAKVGNLVSFTGFKLPTLFGIISGGTDNGGGGGGGGGDNSGSNNNVYPTKVISVYKMIFSVNGPNLASINTFANEVRLAFANGSPLSLVGYGSEGRSSLIDAITSMRKSGRRVSVSIGGGGYTVDLSSTSSFVSQFVSIFNDLGGIDGLDWDIESDAFDGNAVLTISKALKLKYGKDFAITMAPNGGNVDTYLPAAVRMYKEGALDNFGQQFYDAPISISDVRWRIQEALDAGLPQSVISIGMMIANDADHWTNAQCVTNMKNIKLTWPGIQKAYLWEASRTGTLQWITDMNSLL